MGNATGYCLAPTKYLTTAALSSGMPHRFRLTTLGHACLCCMTLVCTSPSQTSHHSLVGQRQVCFYNTGVDCCRYGLLNFRPDALDRFYLPACAHSRCSGCNGCSLSVTAAVAVHSRGRCCCSAYRQRSKYVTAPASCLWLLQPLRGS